MPNRSIVIIKFFNSADAAEFAEAYNGKPFNSMEVSFLGLFHLAN
jgi:BRCA1-associated protein